MEIMSIDECLERFKGVVRARTHVFFGYHKPCQSKVDEYTKILKSVYNFTPEMIADFKLEALKN
jgi:hypothetical protein